MIRTSFPFESNSAGSSSRIERYTRTQKNLLAKKQSIEYFYIKGWMPESEFKRRMYEIITSYNFVEWQLKRIAEKEGI
jgi:hypothetical protein